MDTVLIFGATGTVGAYTSLHLSSLGYKVICVGRRKSDSGFFAEHNMQYLSVDVLKKSQFSKLPTRNIDHVVHLAGAMPSKMGGYEPQSYIDSIITGTYNVLEYCRKVKAKKIIFTQTRADSSYLMGTKNPIPPDIEKKFPLTGDHAIYTICKNAAVDLIEHYYHQYGLKRFILRLPTIYAYSPDKHFYVNGKKQTKAYRYLMDQAAGGNPVEIWGDPAMKKEIVYVKDVTQIMELAVKSTKDGGIYNVGTGKGNSLEEQIKGIVEVFSPPHKKSEILYKPEKPNARQFIHDISKTKRELGFRSSYPYKELLIDFKKEMQENRFAKLWGREDEA
jgi:nucleoside-diphosphate-sugar epimerase